MCYLSTIKDAFTKEILSYELSSNLKEKFVLDYMDYYNNYRYQWDLAKLAPAEYYEYCMTGIYPLPKGDNKNQKNI